MRVIVPWFVPTARLQLTYKFGLHARPSTALYHLVKKHNAKVFIEHDGKKAAADSIIDVLSLGIRPPAEIDFTADGPDSEAVLNEIEQFINNLNTREDWS